MRVGVLGPLQVDVEGAQVVLPSAGQRRLLSLLALHGGSVVPSTAIQEELHLAHGALRTSMSRLRRSIGETAIATEAPGYRLHEVSIDAVRFEQLLSLARSAADGSARVHLSAAVGLWRGAAYAEFAHEPWARAESARLDDARASATEELADLFLSAGEPASALDLLDRLVAVHPYRDRPRALQLRALVALGRRTEALRQFQAYRRLLADEVGAQPSAHLVELDRAIGADDQDHKGSFPPLPLNRSWARERHPAHLVERSAGAPPAPVSSFVGRVAEVEIVRQLADRHRLVTLTGVGGCGKTRLALHAIDGREPDHPGGVRWVELAPVTGADGAIERIALALDVRLVPRQEPVSQLAVALSGRGPTLLVLDNAEHVVEPLAALVAAVLAACPDVRTLVTSREALGLPGEVVWRVPPLSVPTSPPRTLGELDGSDAVELLVQRCRAARPGLVVDDAAAPHLASICTRLDGLPLALELAAASVRTMPLADLAARLDGEIATIGPARSLPERHRSLEACIAWSLDVLDPVDRGVLTRLTAFRAAFSLDAAAAVAADGDDVQGDRVAEIVGRLADKSLLQLDDATGRYRMLETVRLVCARRGRGGGSG